MRRLKTLHIDAERNWGGGQQQVAGLCSYLRDRGHGVKLACRPGSRLEKWAGESGIEPTPVDMRPASLSAVLKLRSIILRERPDVVHLHSARAHVLGSAAARLAGPVFSEDRVGVWPGIVIATRRMDDPIHMVWPNSGAYGSWTTAIVAISSAVREVLLHAGVDERKIRLIESGADVSRFEQAVPDPGLRASLGIDASLPIVCAAATLAERKGIRHLIDAASVLGARSAPVHLIIAGDGEQRNELESFAREKGVSASFLGFRDDMPAILASSDVFAMPSLAEGLGVAVLEAMAAGRPVVASAVGGLRESVLDGVTGFSVPPANPEALAEAIARLIANPSMAAQFGAAGRARARSNYSLENMARKNEALYVELVEQWESRRSF